MASLPSDEIESFDFEWNLPHRLTSNINVINVNSLNVNTNLKLVLFASVKSIASKNQIICFHLSRLETSYTGGGGEPESERGKGENESDTVKATKQRSFSLPFIFNENDTKRFEVKSSNVCVVQGERVKELLS